MKNRQEIQIEKPLGAGPILVTGAAGFIGFHLARKLLDCGCSVVGVDNLNDYYDVSLKLSRLAVLESHDRFLFSKLDITERKPLFELFCRQEFTVVLHMAAQAGVRYSLENPHAYAESNVQGFLNILEGCRMVGIRHLVFASSSSVYGANGRIPFSVHDNVDHPVSLYAATKKTNELMAHAYASLYALPCSGLRLFTVYGPWGRPDMAIFSFTKNILEARPIEVYNNGKMIRDFTYIDDIVEMILRIAKRVPMGDSNWQAEQPDPASSFAPYRIYNLGHGAPVDLMHLIETLEKYLCKKAVVHFLPLQPGDVIGTHADMKDTEREIGRTPRTTVDEGIRHFVEWYKAYHDRVKSPAWVASGIEIPPAVD